MANNSLDTSKNVGVVGLGLMGSSIIVSLLISGHPVKAIAPIPLEAETGYQRILEQLDRCMKSGLINDTQPYLSKLIVTESYDELKDCILVLECVIENLQIKEQVYKKIAHHTQQKTIIASNTSAIPISVLQEYVPYPERFMGIHWAEPAYSTRFLEITCGNNTSVERAEEIYQLAHHWAKEPTLLRKDIRGFITNRLMYAVYRELFALVNDGKVGMRDADKVFKYDVGSWITFMGIFKRMDFEGLEDKSRIVKNILPRLSNNSDVPEQMKTIVAKNGRGIYNQSGLFNYTTEESEQWEHQFADFIEDISRLAKKYPIT